MPDQTSPARRDLLRSAGAALLLQPRTVFGSQANSSVELGLVGCGSRGNWIAPLFTEHANARFVAVADVIKSRLESTPETRRRFCPRLLGSRGRPRTGPIQIGRRYHRNPALLPPCPRRRRRGCRKACLLRQDPWRLTFRAAGAFSLPARKRKAGI